MRHLQRYGRSMAYSLILAPRAQKSFDDAMTYITQVLGAPHAAGRLADSFNASLDALACNPFAYPVDQDITKRVGRETRKKRMGNYRLYFHVSEDLGQVEIAYFFHTRQDVVRHIKGIEC